MMGKGEYYPLQYYNFFDKLDTILEENEDIYFSSEKSLKRVDVISSLASSEVWIHRERNYQIVYFNVAREVNLGFHPAPLTDKEVLNELE